MRVRPRSLAALLSLCAAASAPPAPPAPAAPPVAPVAPVASAAYVVRWRAVADKHGATEAYRVSAVAVSRRDTRTVAHRVHAPVDTVPFAAPAAGDSLAVRLELRSERRNEVSATPAVVAWAVPGAALPPAGPTTPAAPAEPTVPAGAGQTDGAAELPRATVDTRMPAPTGRTIAVAAGGNLQAALDAAQPGDVVSLAPGATFVGNFVLRPKANAAGRWIVVRSAGALPAEGTRVTPAAAAQMPKILTPNAMSALATAPGAQGWRLTGLEVGATRQAPMVYALVSFGATGSEQNTPAEVPSRLVLDRSYVHGTPTLDLRRCVALNSASTAIVDSYLTDCHSNNSDSQAIIGWNGPGPFLIQNNRLEGGSQGIMFGGADPDVPNLIPSDATIRRNYVGRPMAWKGVWRAKNLVELKSGQRVLMEENVFENHWVDAQNGFAFIWWSANADGGSPWSVTQDVVFRWNVVRNVAAGFNLADRYTGNEAGRALQRMRRVTIRQSTVSGIGTPALGHNGNVVQVLGVVEGLTIEHLTAVGTQRALSLMESSAPLPGFRFTDNIVGGEYPLFGDGAQGAAALAARGVPAASVRGNVWVGGFGGAVPPGNRHVGGAGEVGFQNAAAGDLALTAASGVRTAGVGGGAPGADVAELRRRTTAVEQP